MKALQNILFANLFLALGYVEFSDAADATVEWGYHEGSLDQSKWHTMPNSKCAGSRQSPVNINSSALVYDSRLTRLIMSIVNAPGFSAQNVESTLENTGHTISWVPNPMQNIILRNEGQTENQRHEIHGVHFHWGSDDLKGSEHTLNGHMFPMECHVVTYDSRSYADATAAISAPNGLAVYGFFFDLGTTRNAEMEKIANALSSIQKRENFSEPNPTVTLTDVNIANLMPSDLSKYYRYAGSLTTPGCTENVVWTVFKEHKIITEDQLIKFRNVLYPLGIPMVDNYREVQPLNKPNIKTAGYRVVTSSYVPATPPSTQVCAANMNNAGTFAAAVLIALFGIRVAQYFN